MATVLELITDALVTVKALGVGETPGADMTTDALTKFNEVLEALSLQNLAIYASADLTIPLVAGTAVYTFGPGGSGQRPLSMNSIDSAWVTYQNTDFPLEVIPQIQYDGIAVKQVGGMPYWLAYDNGFPNTKLSLYPAPTQNMTLTLSQRQAFAPAQTLYDTFLMPPGYRRMVRLMLAWELLSDYPGMTPDEVAKLQRDVAGALGSVKRANLEPVTLVSDAYGMGYTSGYSRGNWRDGS